MHKPLQIAIPKPCHESWQDMTPVDKGRFCAACQKQVIDFTKATDREIAEHFHNNKNVCGRFVATQLNRNLGASQQKNTLWVAASAAVVSFFALGTQKATAQEKAKTEQFQKQQTTDSTATETERLLVKGTVIDTAEMPIPGVIVKNTNSNESVQTDLDGNYAVSASEGDTLEFSYVAMKTMSVTITNPEGQINLTMEEDKQAITLGFVITPRKRTFFGRLFHSKKNRYRYD